MEIFTFDIMLNGRFICTLKYKYNSIFPIDLEELEKFIFKCNSEFREFEHRFNTICSTEYYEQQSLIFYINYINAEFEQREKLNY